MIIIGYIRLNENPHGIATGDGRGDYSGRNMRKSYSRGNDTRMELEEMLNSTRDPQEAEAIRKILNKL